MTSHDPMSHLEPDDIASNHNSNTLNEISDNVDERSPHVDVLIVLNLRGRPIVERGGEKGGKERREERGRKGGEERGKEEKVWEEKKKTGEGESESENKEIGEKEKRREGK